MTLRPDSWPGPAAPVALDRALAFLLDEARSDFVETCHRMRFPGWAGFTAVGDEQASDVFARAVLLDIAEHGHEAADFRAIARREANYVACAKLRHRRGGWGYFPALPELPPDLDSLAVATTLFARVAPELGGHCAGPLAVALEHRLPSGAFTTWLVSRHDTPIERVLMERGIRDASGDAVDVDVCARFLHALVLRDRARFHREIGEGVDFIVAAQEAHGGWPSAWYSGEVYGNALCIELLGEVRPESAAFHRGIERIVALQRADGGWGSRRSCALDTAVALWLLARHGRARHAEPVERGLDCLLDLQTAEGFWEGTPWIAMNAGRAHGATGPVISHRSTTVTTAFCARALLAAGSPAPGAA